MGNGNGGLSPRGRGKPIGISVPYRRTRSIPAWAGETTNSSALRVMPKVYPRVGGGNSSGKPSTALLLGLSPRGRGKRAGRRRRLSDKGSIPAWAGETGLPGHNAEHIQVYPRVGGGNAMIAG